MSTRSAAVVCVLSAAVALAGCYASTEPATEIGPESATLNGRGTADDGPAISHFEYWLTGRSGTPLRVGGTGWPAGSSGPFSARASHLAASSAYSFRVCGQDGNDFQQTCAQTRTFTTKGPVEDSVYGAWSLGCCASFGIDARSGPAGENPGGHMRLVDYVPENGHTIVFTGIVTCLVVDGSTATVGALGDRKESPPDTTTQAALLVQVVDGRLQADQYSDNHLVGGNDCANPDFSRHFTFGLDTDLIVNDATLQP